MKRIPLLAAAALVPLAVGANEKDLANWDVKSIKGDKRVTDIMDAEVYTADGREIGEVQDVVLDNDGNASLLIASNGRQAVDDVAEGRNIETPADPRDTDVPENAEVAARHNQADAPNVRQEQPDSDDFEYQESEDLMRTAGGGAWENAQAVSKLDWDDATFDPERSAIMLDSESVEFTGEATSADRMDRRVGASDDDRAEQTAQGVRLADGDVTARSLLGMDVNLENEESFGRIEDVLITDDGEASAFVVDSWDLVDKQRYAIPADISAVDTRTGEVRLGYSEDEMDELEEFDFDDLEASRM